MVSSKRRDAMCGDTALYAFDNPPIRGGMEEEVGQGQRLLSVKLDDPSFPAPIYASLVESEGEDLALIWSRRRIAD